ncbi:MAG: type II secretion system inner membrane protein GspF [Deltaproteobacteria bacterium]|nr:type II secretion system inner membrane protein GspF [Deltaproteobacteria bacterium]
MPTFQYSAYNSAGAETTGVIEAENLRDAKQRLRGDGLLPREILLASNKINHGPLSLLKRSPGLTELALLTRRMATLLGAAVPVYEAVITLQEQERPGELRNVLGRLRDRLAEGASLAKAMGAEPRIFNESYVSMVAAGEASGALELVLERLAEFLEEQAATRSKITTALAYPALMVVVGTSVMLFLLAFVIPRIVTVFENSKAALPLITIALIKVSGLLHKWWWAILVCVAIFVVTYNKLIQREDIRCFQDRLLLRIPLFGSLRKQLVLSRFSKVLGLLLNSGVPVIRALEITGEVVVNREYRTLLAHVKEELIQGGSLSASLNKSPLFPPMLVHMIAVGEKSGTLEAMLIKSGEAFERELDTSVRRMMTLLEPLLILGMGLSVGLVVLAVLLPIFQLNELVK